MNFIQQKYCYVLKGFKNHRTHLSNGVGRPLCGTKADACALEYTDDPPQGEGDACLRCFPPQMKEL